MSRRCWLVLAALLLAVAPLRAQDPPAGKGRHLLLVEGGVQLDPAGSTVELKLVPYPADLHMLQQASFPSFADAAKAAEKLQLPLLVSADAVRAYFEEYNDGLLGGLRLVLGNGNGNEIQGKVWLLHQLLDRLAEKRNTIDAARREPCDLAVAYVVSALMAGGQAPPVPPELEARVRAAVDAVRAPDPALQPYGYLLRHADFKHLHALDRAVARGIPLEGDAGLLAVTLVYDMLFRRQDLDYEARVIAATTEVLCGPPQHMVPADLAAVFKPGDSFENLSKAPAKLASFRERLLASPAVAAKKSREPALVFQIFPPLTDVERRLVSRLPETAGKGLQTRLVTQARAEIGLDTATWKEGWVGTRAGVLEALYRRPRSAAARVALYAGGLDDIGTDEFSPQAVPPPTDGSEPVPAPKPDGVVPPIRLEPAPEFYRAAARAVRSLREGLLEAMGGSALTTLARIEANGQSAALRTNHDLPRLERLFLGLALQSSAESGVEAGVTDEDLPAADRDKARGQATGFCATLWKDPALALDARQAIPVERVTREGKSFVRAWASLGVRLVPCELRYVTPPKGYDAGGKQVTPKFATGLVLLPVRVLRTVEVEGDQFPTPEAFRQYCASAYTTPKLIALNRAENPMGKKYSMILLGGCGVGFVLLVLGTVGMWYVKRQMND